MKYFEKNAVSYKLLSKALQSRNAIIESAPIYAKIPLEAKTNYQLTSISDKAMKGFGKLTKELYSKNTQKILNAGKEMKRKSDLSNFAETVLQQKGL